MSTIGLNIELDAREFNRAAEALFEKSSRTYPEFVNGQLYGLALQALNQTIKADKAKMRAELLGEAHNTNEIDGSDTLASRIVNSRLRAAGRPMIWGALLMQAARRLVAARSRATAFVKSGWLPAIMTLARFVKGRRGRQDRDARIRGRPKGSVKQAVPMMSGIVSGSITNTAIRQSLALTIAANGLRKALAIQTADMLAELQRRIQRDIDSVR